ncbi:multiple organellar RNA editing factor 3, mitochondrial [Hordeum vulgare]|nr:multiple organellar RNA editing factor 3, mitochondrial [Hordeum vulgare]
MAAVAVTRRRLSALLLSPRAIPRRFLLLAGAAASASSAHPSPWAPPSRGAKTALPGRPGHSPLNDPSPNWSNRPPKETILLDGCDYEHWLIVMEFPADPKPSEEDMVAAYVKTLTAVLGSEEEAKKKIYSVCTTTYTGFGALISEELSYKVKGLPGVLWVLPDSYLDVPNKDYGGDLFVDGKVIHRPQFQFTERQQELTSLSASPSTDLPPPTDLRNLWGPQLTNKTRSTIIVVVLWNIWKRRNAKVFRGDLKPIHLYRSLDGG